MRPLVLSKAFACLVVICWSPWICLAERGHSSFALVISYMQVRIYFLLPVMPTRAVSGRSKPVRVGPCIEILMLSASMDGILFQGEENILNVRETTSTNFVLSYEVSFDLHPFVNLKREPML
jgi:hypothetical protein